MEKEITKHVHFMINKWYEIGKYCQYLSTCSPLSIYQNDKFSQYIYKNNDIDLFKNSSDKENDILIEVTEKNKTTRNTEERNNLKVNSNYLNISDQLQKQQHEIRIPLLNLFLIIEKASNTLMKDYENFVQLFFPNEITSFYSIIVRYQLYSTFCIITRLLNALGKFLDNENLHDPVLSVIYFVHVLLPKQHLYHSKSGKAISFTDRINNLYKLGIHEHLGNLMLPHTLSLTFDKYQFNIEPEVALSRVDIAPHHPILNNILKWSVELCSYPILPPNIIGNLVSTTDKRQKMIKILSPGLDNLQHHKSIADPTVCCYCKLFNLSVGQIDDTEQRDYLKCSCNFQKNDWSDDSNMKSIMEPSSLDKLMTINARTALNLVYLSFNGLLTDTKDIKQYDCKCPEHSLLFKNHIEKNYNLLSKLQVLTNL